MPEAFLVGGVRTPQGKYGGALAGVRPDDLAALVVREGRWQVMGRSYVVACRSPGGGQPVRIDVFHDGDRGSLDDWKPRPGPAGSRR